MDRSNFAFTELLFTSHSKLQFRKRNCFDTDLRVYRFLDKFEFDNVTYAKANSKTLMCAALQKP